MDLSTIEKVVETTYVEHVNAYLATKRWVVITTASGKDSDDYPEILYALGWLGPEDPERPDEDSSEFPELPDVSGWGNMPEWI